MPGTITDDKCAFAPDDVANLQKHTVTLQNHSEFTTGIRQPNVTTCISREFLLRKFIIGGLAALVLTGLANRAKAGCVNSYYPTDAKCRDAWRFLDLDGSVNSLYSGSPRQFISSRHDGHGWFDNLKTGDYIDKGSYYFLDEGQYYYLDKTQYKLLGGANYILGHPCYPKLFERNSELASGFANRRKIYVPWYDNYWDYLTTGNSALSGCLRTVCNAMPTDNYVVWHSYFKPGDNIDKWRYQYLDKGRYYHLDVTQYKWLGGMAYLFESTHYGNPAYYASDSHHAIREIMLKKSQTETASIMTGQTIPEPASVMILGLGSLIFFLRRRIR